MLRVSLLNSRKVAVGTPAARISGQWYRERSVVCDVCSYRRSFATGKKPDETLFPGSESARRNDEVLDKPPPLPSVTKPASSTIIPPEGVPKTLPSADEIEARVIATSRAPTAKASSPLPSVASAAESSRKSPASSSANLTNPPPPTPPSPSTLASQPTTPPQTARRKPRRFRRFLSSLIILSGLGYAGGVYYSLVSDNFHDFFTEYIPFGDDAVGYFEEREFKKRFPPRTAPPRLHPQLADEPKVTIPSKSGMSVRPAGAENDSSHNISSLRGRHMSAIEDVEKEVKPAPEARGGGVEAMKKGAADKAKKVENKVKSEASSVKNAAKKAAGKVEDAGQDVSKQVKKEAKKASAAVSQKAAEVKEATKSELSPPTQALPTIDHLKVKNAEEPAVQDLVKMLNDIITVINADRASGKYSSTITTAKEKVNKIIKEIGTIKASEKHAAENEIKTMHQQFDNGAKELASRLEREMRDQEIHWKEDYENEREKLVHSYESRLKAELEAAKQMHERQLQTALTEQQIGQIRQFTQMVRDAVEQERGGRLSKLSELEKSVHDLERLTAESSSVVDKTLQTQHLLVAVDALTAKLDLATRPVPFLIELAAVREAANFGNAGIGTDNNSGQSANAASSSSSSSSSLSSSPTTTTANANTSQPDPVIHAALSTIPTHIYNTGIPTAADLRARFRIVASQVRKAALLPESTSDAGVASHAASWMLSNFLARKEGLPAGEDVESVLARAESWLARGDLESAAREVNGLRGWAKTLARDWLEDVRSVCAVRMAVDVMNTEARLQSLLVK